MKADWNRKLLSISKNPKQICVVPFMALFENISKSSLMADQGQVNCMADGNRPLDLGSITPKGPGLFSTVSVTCRGPQGAGGEVSVRRETGSLTILPVPSMR